MKRFLLGALLLANSSIVFAQENAWDALRPIAHFADEFDFPIKLFVLLLSLAIFVIAGLAYTKSKSKRLLLVAFAFFLFSLKWLVKILDVYYSPGNFLSDSSENVFELGILLSLLVALFYRRSWSKNSK